MPSALYDAVRNAFEKLPDSVHKHWLPDNPKTLIEKFRWLLACGRIFCPEYQFKWPQLDWWKDESFASYLRLFNEDQGMNSDRRWNLLQFLRNSLHLKGDTAECGVYLGASSYLICQENAFASSSRMHYVFDSFEGLSQPIACDGEHWKANALCASEADFHKNLSPFTGQYKTLKGWIPERFSEVASREFAFVHLDVDLYEPTSASIQFFYPRLVTGGILVCDDYGFSTCPGATKAINEFMEDKAEQIIYPASGGAIVVKR